MFRFVVKPWKHACIYSYFPCFDKLTSFISLSNFTAAKFKDCARSYKVCFFVERNLVLLICFEIHCSYLLSKILSAGLHVVVFKELLKLHVHSLKIKELKFWLLFGKETTCLHLCHLFFFNLSQALSSDWEEKVTFNPCCQILQCCCQGSVPTSCHWWQFSWPKWFQISFILQL